jgi:RING finger/CHY zinc finger protein 1
MDHSEILNNLQQSLDMLESQDIGSESDTCSNTGSIHNNTCTHYSRHCKLICPQCDESYSCRICHDEVMTSHTLPFKDQHTMNRHDIEKIICVVCDMVQPVSGKCVECDQLFAEYFCDKCNLFDNNGLVKQIFHCDKCTICRIGGSDNFFHCADCSTCINVLMKDTHKCQNIVDEMCPICSEDLFSSRNSFMQLKCGHWIHNNCCNDMIRHNNLTCPLCLKMFVDSTTMNTFLDNRIKETPMIDEYQDKIVNILCNECLESNDVLFHFYGLKCPDCGSYNTKN